MNRFLLSLFLFAGSAALIADNQTPNTSFIITQPVLPFTVKIRKAGFSLPNGWHSGVFATHDGKWLILSGRTNGMHGFNNDDNNFPPQQQNDVVFVVDPHKKKVHSRSLSDHSGLTQEQIDSLTVTSPQFYQSGKQLYITGGYGVTTSTGQFSTKPLLTAIDVPEMIKWVEKRHHHVHIRQLSHPIFQVTGGDMAQIGNHPTLLVFGQNFDGFYHGSSNGIYTNQVRRFFIKDNGKKLRVKILDSEPDQPDPNFRRRDLNIVPIVQKDDDKITRSLVAFSGVFTETDGAWTVPVTVSSSGKTKMKNPSSSKTFKQGMNNYICATAGLFSSKHNDMYTLFFGGITYGYFQNGIFLTDTEFPFFNQVTAVKIDKHNRYQQYFLPTQYPYIESTQSNPGNQLLFGAGAQFILSDDVANYGNEVLKLDKISKRTKIGYIVGGIQSTLPNTNTMSDSSASGYIFEVIVEPKDES